jgi:hypothetical protein
MFTSNQGLAGKGMYAPTGVKGPLALENISTGKYMAMAIH